MAACSAFRNIKLIITIGAHNLNATVNTREYLFILVKEFQLRTYNKNFFREILILDPIERKKDANKEP